MQSLFRRAWCHEQGDKKPDKALLSNPLMRPSSIVDVTPLFKMKRKRSDSPEATLAFPVHERSKKRKTTETDLLPLSQPGHEQAHSLPKSGLLAESNDKPSADPAVASAMAQPPAQTTGDPLHAGGVSTTEREVLPMPPLASSHSEVDSRSTHETSQYELRQVIEHQFNLEILLKHRELRLIEQELAKCQVALEQLRRCELVPYPGSVGFSESLSNGNGPSIKAQTGFTQPQAPAPWGVTDGPYTRHYARWLLNDSTFDSIPIQQASIPTDYFSSAPEGRSTRNSGAGLGRASKSRPSRDSIGNLSHALPNYPVQPRGKGGPLVIKRLADNKFVKLICNNCQRGDFSSVQGFLNHCRIAHKVDYKSHEAAATDCGRPLDDDEMHLIPQATPAATPAARTPGPKPPVPQPAPTAFVHPLNAPVMPRYTWKVQAAAARAAAAAAARAGPLPLQSQSAKIQHSRGTKESSGASPLHSTPLVASASMPYLSTQFAKRGLGGNLQKATDRAREKIDLGFEADDDDSSASIPRKLSTPKSALAGTSAMRFTKAPGTSIIGRPQSRKGQHAPASRPRPAPLAPQASHVTVIRSETMEIPESPQESSLSPHTADSNPGLVSDHEDDDAVSDLDEARSERHVSPDQPLSQLGNMRRGLGACGDAMDLDVEVEDDADGHHEVLIRPRGLAYQEFTQRSSGSTSARPVSRFGEAAK